METIMRALEQINYLSIFENDTKLTEVDKQMKKLSIDTQQSKNFILAEMNKFLH